VRIQAKINSMIKVGMNKVIVIDAGIPIDKNKVKKIAPNKILPAAK